MSDLSGVIFWLTVSNIALTVSAVSFAFWLFLKIMGIRERKQKEAIKMKSPCTKPNWWIKKDD